MQVGYFTPVLIFSVQMMNLDVWNIFLIVVILDLKIQH
jgi:hypothetical protein